jgi:hypothetical protein
VEVQGMSRKIASLNISHIVKIEISPSAIARRYNNPLQNNTGHNTRDLLREALDPVTAHGRVDTLSDNNPIRSMACWITVIMRVN